MTDPRVDLPGADTEQARALGALIARRGDEILRAWVRLQTAGDAPRGGGGSEDVIANRSRAILAALQEGLERTGNVELAGPDWQPLRDLIAERSRRGARDGDTPTDTAKSVLALREAIFVVTQTEHADNSRSLAESAVTSGRVVDAMALLTFDTYVHGREEVIVHQASQLLELSTPVVRLWDGIVALPLVGTLDSSRAQVVMESMLTALDEEHASVAILDITGVPTVDTLVAQHLLKTVTATRLMGADCIISGIRPQTAQTIVQLGIDLADITTRATLADALVTAIARVSPSADGLGR